VSLGLFPLPSLVLLTATPAVDVHAIFAFAIKSPWYDLSKPTRPFEAWWDETWRIQLGTMAVPAPWISALKAVAYIGGRYSMHRSLLGKSNNPIPIMSFRTQQWPIAHATAVGMVMANWFLVVVRQAMENTSDPRVRHAMSVIIKTMVCRNFQRCVPEVAERCGAQGTFEHNYMARIEVYNIQNLNAVLSLTHRSSRTTARA